MNNKPFKRAERLEIIYNNKQWNLLNEFRLKSIGIMEKLNSFHIKSIVHGSIARGDISKTSDIDIFLPVPPSSFFLENILERNNLKIYSRRIVQATPSYALKGYIELDPYCSLSFPLVKLRDVEKNFYTFGGKISISDIKKGKRVLGINKRLMLIEPTIKGHVESTVIGREKEISHLMRLSINTIKNRVNALLRRDKIGRTGVFIERELNDNETFEQILKKLSDNNPAVRRRINFFQ